ncbi:MAG TPA: YggS family pyridoxal phosphate-dependent enzyme [Actinophytocola sp.]|uniref:YggS family pyridoxal phosphate-dependent enzyme n=1 Tax=Actinophytocola sp. TaxID=1872138 RepID=UPI002DDCF4FA|nr:YggS family pyridoxal phosphate-dependent enzyme [Actinophytocola sp.]HEV2781979.1 YggS family pyridoxal phosphate-dependent enzyme [Actinophytocola sp.]
MIAERGRLGELSAALAGVRERIDAAARAVGRDPAGIRLLAVTKTFPASDAALLTDLGVLELAENREQEGGRKAGELTALRPDVQVRWHMVGRLQRNKARSVVRWAAEVQSVDSVRLARALERAMGAARAAGERGEPLDVLVQVSIDGDPERGGCPMEELPGLADGVARSGELRLRGIMAVAPLTMSPDAAFERLARAADRLRHDHPQATEISAGMTGDLEQAVAHGSTCVRVGTALLGARGLASP